MIIKLRNLTCQKGMMLESHKKLTHLLIQTGHGVPIGGTDNSWTQLRTAYGLNPIPPTTHSFPDALREIQILIEDTGFDILVGFPLEFNSQTENSTKNK